LISIESLRESTGGIGFLKYSGIPTLQENALKNAVYSNADRTIRNLRLAQFLVNADFEKKSDFLTFYGLGLTDRDETHLHKGIKESHMKPEFLIWLLNRKISTLRLKIKQNGPFSGEKKCLREIARTWPSFDDVNSLCEAFCLSVV